MFEIGAFEAENTLESLLDRVQDGEEILITRRGRPVARLVPSTGSSDRSQAEAAARRIEARASELKTKFDWKEVREDRDAGRP